MTDYSEAAAEVARQPAVIFGICCLIVAGGMGFLSWLHTTQIGDLITEQHEQNAILRDRMGQCFNYLIQELSKDERTRNDEGRDLHIVRRAGPG